MGPIRYGSRMTVHVHMVESVPNPHWLQIGIKINQGVPSDVGRSSVLGFRLNRGDNHDPMSIGQNRDVVVHVFCLIAKSCGGQAVIESVN